VGKGIIFDSGGMDLKTYGQAEMKEDMAGIAYMYGLIKKLAKDSSKVLEKTKWHVIVILPMVVNGIGADATLPGSVVEAYNGKTIEVVNTDAEGRLVLADAMSWASEKFNPTIIVDIATLTGGVEFITSVMGAVAMGHLNESREREFIKMIHENDDKDRCLWMPIWKEYKYLLKSDVADLRNIPIKKARADTMLAGLFLSEFVSPTAEWIHIDIGSVPNKGWGLNGLYNWILKNINNK